MMRVLTVKGKSRIELKVFPASLPYIITMRRKSRIELKV